MKWEYSKKDVINPDALIGEGFIIPLYKEVDDSLETDETVIHYLSHLKRPAFIISDATTLTNDLVGLLADYR